MYFVVYNGKTLSLTKPQLKSLLIGHGRIKATVTIGSHVIYKGEDGFSCLVSEGTQTVPNYVRKGAII